MQKSADSETNNNKWKSKNLNFFNFHLFTLYDIESMIRDDKNIYYHNVYIFIERVLDLIATKNQKFVKINFNTYLKENVLMWYIVKLSTLKRSVLRQINSNENWIIMFCKRFKFNQSTIINVLMIEYYFISNVRNNRKSINYVQQMINHAKNVSFDIFFIKSFKFNVI